MAEEHDPKASDNLLEEKRIEMPHFLEDIPEEVPHCRSHIVRSYESSMDMFVPDEPDRLSYDQTLHFDDHQSHYSMGATVSRPGSRSAGKHSNATLPHHHNLLIDEEEFEEHKHSSNEIELVFQNLTHTVKNGQCQRQVLSDISGYANAGQVLVVMGPSGSGKTSLLNVLSGRVKPCQGTITLNNTAINKQLRRRIAYVLQQDIFFPRLTLKQTLVYTARLRLPQSMKDCEKLAFVNKLIEDLDLKDCQDTVIGESNLGGLSGGEKKRMNIASELLTNPSIMLIDEPTSGLDSCIAHNLVQTIKNFAVKRKKTIVMTVHQPSSQMFYMFDKLLLLSSGKLSYFGSVNEVVPFFNNIGLTISLHYNPADFILEKVKNLSCQNTIIEAAKSLPKTPKYAADSDFKSHSRHSPKFDDCWKKESLKSIELHVSEDSQQVYNKVVNDSDSGRSSWSDNDCISMFSWNSSHRDDLFNKIGSTNKSANSKWPTSMWTQIKILTGRNFIEAKSRMLSKMNWVQTIGLAFTAGLIWFRAICNRTEDSLQEIRGWIFFSTTYWMMFGLFQAMVSFPAERQVINKERASGAYRLSSYYIAKMIGELPLTVALPSVFFCISYPMLGFCSISSFLSMWVFLIVSTLCAQSVGLFIGAACPDLEKSMTYSALYTLSTMLFAGYYTKIPFWLSWVRYFSMVYYAFLNMQMVEFGSTPIQCSKQASKFEFCLQNSSNNTTPEYIPYSELELELDLMNNHSKPFPIWFNTLILFLFFVVFRTMGYLVLRYGRK